MSTGTVATAGGATVQDDEWFGEGSAFDSGEDLAAALFALAGATRADAVPKAEVIWPSAFQAPEPESDFLEVARTGEVESHPARRIQVWQRTAIELLAGQLVGAVAG